MKKKKIKYGDYRNYKDDRLIKIREEFMDCVEKHLVHEHLIECFHELLEVERELTLREEDPR